MLSLDRMEQQNVFIPDENGEEIDADLVIVGGPSGHLLQEYKKRETDLSICENLINPYWKKETGADGYMNIRDSGHCLYWLHWACMTDTSLLKSMTTTEAGSLSCC